MYNSQVNMLATDPTPGCIDSNGGVTVDCADAFWTTSDNLPTCATLTDFGYASVADACINKILGCNSVYVPVEWRTTSCPKDPLNFEFTSKSIPASEQGTWLSGFRYEAFFAIPIPIGAPGDQHFIITTGTLSDGKAYAIKADIATLSLGTQNFNGPVDVVAPQCIDEYLRGNLDSATTCANALIGTWDGNGVGGVGAGGASNTYSTWQLGQVMFVMRVLGMDTDTSSVKTDAGTMTYAAAFNAMEAKLWAVQAAYTCPVGSSGCLPNAYDAANQGSGGTDAENQDAGLLPFSVSVIDLVKSAFGECSSTSAPPGPSDSNLCDSAAKSTTTSTQSSTSTTSSSNTTETFTNSTSTVTNSTLITSTNLTSTQQTISVQSTSHILISTKASFRSSSIDQSNPSANEVAEIATQKLEAEKVQTAAVTMGTGSGAVVFLSGLFPLSYILRNDIKHRRAQHGSDIARGRLGKS